MTNGPPVLDRWLPAQRAMAIDCERHRALPLYLVSVDADVHGPLDPAALEQALRLVALRHPAMQGVVTPWDGVERIPTLPVLERVPTVQGQAMFDEDMALADPLRPGPMRFRLGMIRPDRWQLRFTFHHLLADRLSVEHMLDELSACLTCADESATPDYLDIDQGLRADPREIERCLRHWREDLSGCATGHRWRLPPLRHDLDTDPPGPVEQTQGLLPPADWQGLQTRAARLGCTAHALVLAGFAAALAAFDARVDQVLGIPVSLHDLLPVATPVIGPFMDLFPVRLAVRGDRTLDDLALEAHRRIALAMAHRAAPFSEIVRALGLAGSDRSPLVQTVFAWGGASRRRSLGAATLVLRPPSPYPTALDLTVLAHAGDDGLWLAVDHGRPLASLARQVLAAFIATLRAWAASGEALLHVADLPSAALPAGERDAKREASAPASHAAGNTPCAAGVQASAWIAALLDRLQSDPGGVALIDGEREVSRSQFVALVARIGRLLRERLAPGETAALYAGRSAGHLAAVLAGLQTGRVIALLDPDVPPQLVADALDSADVRLVLNCAETEDRVPAPIPRWRLPLHDEGEAGVYSAASWEVADGSTGGLLVFTSGSTGRPRPVLLGSRAITAHACWFAQRAGLTPRDRVLQFGSVAFDAYLEETLPALFTGATIVLRRPDTSASAERFLEDCAHFGTTVADLPTGFFAMLVEQMFLDRRSFPPSLRLVVIGGEAVSPAALRAWRACAGKASLLNSYGPTEATVVVSAGEPPGLGAPRPGVQLHLLDPLMRPVPDGIVGEICIGGDTLAAGYRLAAADTAARFMPDPFSPTPGARMYRTGDLAWRDTHGHLHFAARLDRQVKVRGMRIEPAALESIWQSLPGIAAAAVVATTGGKVTSLVALLVLEAQADPLALRQLWQERFSAAQWPARLVFLDRLPRTLRGKLDRAALANLAADTRPAARERPVDPAHPLLSLIGEVLGSTEIDGSRSFIAHGGHSLLALRIIGEARRRLGIRLPAEGLLGSMSLDELAIASGAVSSASEAQGAQADAEGGTSFPAWPSELAVLVDEAMSEGPSLYHLVETFTLDPAPARSELRIALERLCATQPLLRAVLDAASDSPRWRMLPPEEVTAAVLSDEDESANPRPVDTGCIDPREGPGWRLSVKRSGTAATMKLQAHHAVFDGAGIALFWRLLIATLGGAELPATPPIPAWPHDPATDRWWEERLTGVDATALPPSDQDITAAMRSTAAHCLRVPMDGRAIEALREDAKVTRFCAALSCVVAWLHRALARDELVVGVPVSLAGALGSTGLIRSATRLLPLHTRLPDGATTRAIATDCRRALAEVLEHGSTASSTLARYLRAAGAVSGKPGIVIDLDDRGPHDPSPVPAVLTSSGVRAPLEIAMHRNGDGAWSLELRASAVLYERDAVQHWSASLRWFLQDLADHPSRPLRQRALIAPDSPAAARTSGSPASPPDIAGELAALLETDTDAVAVVDASGSHNRAAIAARVAAIAGMLRCAAQVGPGERVGVALPRSTAHLCALLAIWRLGATPVLMDPVHPAERLEAMARLVPMRAVLFDTDDETRQSALGAAGAAVLAPPLESSAARCVPSALEPAAALPTIAYVAFTSGTTGTPRAVLCSWPGIANLLQWSRRNIPLGPQDRFLHIAAPAFDIALWELLHPLLSGAILVILPADAHGDVNGIADWIGRHAVTAAHFVPSILAPFLEVARPSTLRTIVAGGESLSPSLAAAVVGRLGATLQHSYGPTEAAIFCLCWQASRALPAHRRLPLGRPVDGCTVSIVDRCGNVLPRGLLGELMIEGPQVGEGYLDESRETARRFAPAPGGRRCFLTSDLALMESDGTLRFHGRRDRQVKLGGVRIELSEVEAVLQRATGVARAVAAVRTDPAGQAALVAWVQPRDRHTAALTAARAAVVALPAAARPRRLVALEHWPVTANGKLDLRALPDPDWSAARGEGSQAASGPDIDPLVASIVQAWAGVLGLPSVNPDADLFASGGDSLTAIRIVARLKTHGIATSLRDLFEHPSPLALAAALRADIDKHASPQAEAAESPWFAEESPLTPAADAWLRRYGPQAPEGIQARVTDIPGIDRAHTLQACWQAIVDSQPALRLQVRCDAGGGVTATLRDHADAVFCWVDDGATDHALETLARARVNLPEGHPAALSVTRRGDRLRVAIAVHHAAIDLTGWQLLLRMLRHECLRGTPAAPMLDMPWRTALRLAWKFGPWLDSPDAGVQRAPDGTAPDRPRTPSRHRRSLLADTVVVEEWRKQARARAVPISVLLSALAARAYGAVLDDTPIDVDVEIDLRNETSGIESRLLGWFAGLARLHISRPGPAASWIDSAMAAHRQRSFVAGHPVAQLAVHWLATDPHDAAGNDPGEIVAARPDGSTPLHAITVEAEAVDGRLVLQVDADADRIDAKTFGRFVEVLETALRESGDAVDVEAQGAGHPLTALQLSMLSETLRDARCYHTQICYALHGQVDPVRLRRAWSEVAQSHDAFRIAFDWQEAEEPRQWLDENGAASRFDWKEIVAPAHETADSAMMQVLDEDLRTPFDLTQAPLSRWRLVRAQDGDRLLWSHHHMLFDGWSLGLIGQAVARCYAGDGSDAAHWPASAPPSFIAFVRWAAIQADSTDLWASRMAELLRPCRLWTTPVPAHCTAASLGFVLDKATTSGLRALAIAQSVSEHTVVLAGWLLCLAQMTGQHAVACAIALSQRPAELPGSEHIVGLCMNAVPIVAMIDPSRSGSEFIRSVRGTLTQAMEHGHGSLAQAMTRATRQREFAGPPLDSMLVFENVPGERSRLQLDSVASLEILRSWERSAMPFILVCEPGEQLRFELLIADRSMQPRASQIERTLTRLLGALAGISRPARRDTATH